MEIIQGEVDDRKIYWFWEPNGGMGKSALCRYLAIKMNALLVSGKASDMKAALALIQKNGKPMPTILLMDIPRTVEHLSYTGMEEIKNGVFFSAKYESGMVCMNSPHFICFANREPEREKMSADRWVIKEILA